MARIDVECCGESMAQAPPAPICPSCERASLTFYRGDYWCESCGGEGPASDVTESLVRCECPRCGARYVYCQAGEVQGVTHAS